MNLSHEQQLAHARVLRARGSALPPQGLPGTDILDSWLRSMDAGLDFGGKVQRRVVAGEDLARRRDRAAVVRRLAQAELETLAQQIAGSNFLLAFADTEGVILDLYADNRFAMSGSTTAIIEGSCWSEAICGTNGMGMALASGRSAAVSGLEHYLLTLGDISCTAVPVRDALGEVVGVLDASSYFASRQLHTQALVQMAATHMENGLLAYQMRGHLLLALHPRSEFLWTLSAGLLAIDEQGCVLAVNARGRQLMQGLQVRPGATFESLFGEPLDSALARLHRTDEIHLQDVMGSTLCARSVSRATGSVSHVPRPSVHRAPRRMQAPVLALPSASLSPSAVLEDPDVLEVFRLAEAAVRLKAPLLIQGETGTGKDVLARHVHQASGRSGAFIAVNCAALPAELFEAELFGHVGGAFTGARREGSVGLIASADGGTLLLDELRELPLQLQAALLRFLDDGVVRPVGGTASRRVDVQLLAATNVPLADEVAHRRFRADLFYRLNTVQVTLPPLRLRRDFAAVVAFVLRGLDPAARLAPDALARLSAHPWPGNFRELRAVLTRALLAREDHEVRASDLGVLLPGSPTAASSGLQQVAIEAIRREYERTGLSVSQTSRNLGISRTTVYRHLGAARGARSTLP